MFNVAILSLQQRRNPAHLRRRVTSTSLVMSRITAPIGTLLTGIDGWKTMRGCVTSNGTPPNGVHFTSGDEDLVFLRDLLNHANDLDHDTLIENMFVPENLDKLNRIKTNNPGAYVLVREACQVQKIPIGKLESAKLGGYA